MHESQYEDLPRPQGVDADAIVGPFWPEMSIRDLLDTVRAVDLEASNFEARMQALPPQGDDDQDRASHRDRLTRFAQQAPYSASVVLGATRTHQLTLTAAVERFRTTRQLAYLVGETFDDEAARAAAHALCLQSSLWLSGVFAKVNNVSPLKSTDKEGE
ncbi:hypothetical protein BKG82_26970 [Mycobacteroides chelonae]|uniref:Uncharacterized protein n=1 Tax=Mycobacteroides chelonae TaxID=1774 RepID=A0A1S1LIQ6_MYCCH|nr:hypothetical protein [Mycobacteroides chelonae]OHU47296.1 hypothetical protein BKG82_26970 [Mycobacteroides chelonae]